MTFIGTEFEAFFHGRTQGVDNPWIPPADREQPAVAPGEAGPSSHGTEVDADSATARAVAFAAARMRARGRVMNMNGSWSRIIPMWTLGPDPAGWVDLSALNLQLMTTYCKITTAYIFSVRMNQLTALITTGICRSGMKSYVRKTYLNQYLCELPAGVRMDDFARGMAADSDFADNAAITLNAQSLNGRDEVALRGGESAMSHLAFGARQVHGGIGRGHSLHPRRAPRPRVGCPGVSADGATVEQVAGSSSRVGRVGRSVAAAPHQRSGARRARILRA